MIPITPVSRDMLADQVRHAIDFFPDIWEVAGCKIRCSATDLVWDKERVEAGESYLLDATVIVINEDVKKLGIKHGTRGRLFGSPVRVYSIVYSADGRTTQYVLRKDNER